jgi:hypothetical protein
VILVCAATGIEARACRRGIHDAHGDTRFRVLQTGVGARAARDALQSHLARGERPSAVVSTGFAGATGHGLDLGRWVVAAEVARETAADLLAPPAWVSALRTRLEAVPVRCLQVDAVWIGEGAAALPGALPRVVDMESHALAELAQEAGLPFVCCRVVSDTPSLPLPQAFRHLTAAATGGRPLERLRSAGRGAADALGAPRALARYLAASRRLPQALAEGWRVIASGDRCGGMLPLPWNDGPEAMSAQATRRSARTFWP